MANPSKPQLLSFLTCDGVHQDPSTRKYTLLGLFNGLQGVQFPMTHPRMFAFVNLSELREGEHQLRLSLALPGQEPVFMGEQTFHAAGPLQRVQHVIQMLNISFPHDGDYDFMLEIDDEVLLIVAFPVRALQMPPGVRLQG